MKVVKGILFISILTVFHFLKKKKIHINLPKNITLPIFIPYELEYWQIVVD